MSQKIRFGVLGCGSIGPTHCAAIQQIADAELVAVADSSKERAEAVARKYDVSTAFQGEEDLLADPDIDVICICTPSGMHAEGAIQALRAGKHVIVEKPMDVSLEACDRLIAAEDETGKKLSIISQHRFDAATVLVKDAIDSGKLGKIALASATVNWYRTQQYYDSGDWRGTWAWDGGGALMNQGVHTVDLLQWLAGGVQSLYGQFRTIAHDRIEVEDVAAASLVFNNGAIGTISATTAAWDGYPVRIEIYGTEGTAIIEGDRLKLLRFKNGEEYKSEESAAHALSVAKGGTASVKEEAAQRLTVPSGSAAADAGAVWGDAHRAQFEDFIRAIRTDTKPLIHGREGKKPLEIILGVYRSARTGQSVTIG